MRLILKQKRFVNNRIFPKKRVRRMQLSWFSGFCKGRIGEKEEEGKEAAEKLFKWSLTFFIEFLLVLCG